ncbi:MAG: hypothetical protein EBS62_14900, partial [Betaproteobacteria bacterium]|nr:hypothetical protein [Betaproteobacteria bacterium]
WLIDVVKCKPTWTSENIIENEIINIKSQVGDKSVICGLSGGVDSAVAAALVQRAIGSQLTCVFVDHGLLREGEAEQVERDFVEATGVNMMVVNAQEKFLSALQRVTEPEEKRKIIGREFIRSFEEAATKISQEKKVEFLVQGTLYPDVVEVDVLNVIDAGLHPGADQHLNRDACHAGVGPHVGMGANAQAQDLALTVQRHLRMALDVATVCAGEEVLAAVGDPLHRALQAVSTIGGHHVFGVGTGFHAKAATHVANHDAHLLGRQAQQGAHHGAHTSGHLAAHADGQAALVHIRQHAARLDRQRGHTLVINIEFDHVFGRRKSLVHRSSITIAGFGAAVVGSVAQQRGVGREGVLQRDGARQFFVVHHHGLGSVFGLLFGIGHDGHHGLTHKAHAPEGQRAAGSGGCGFSVGTHKVGQGGHVFQAGRAPL